MPNPAKGEGVTIEINGQSYPLIFDYNAIAKIESGYGQSIGEVQLDLPKVAVLFDLLDAALVGFDGDLKTATVPPLKVIQERLQKALFIAYYGTAELEELEADEEKPAKKKK